MNTTIIVATIYQARLYQLNIILLRYGTLLVGARGIKSYKANILGTTATVSRWCKLSCDAEYLVVAPPKRSRYSLFTLINHMIMQAAQVAGGVDDASYKQLLITLYVLGTLVAIKILPSDIKWNSNWKKKIDEYISVYLILTVVGIEHMWQVLDTFASSLGETILYQFISERWIW